MTQPFELWGQRGSPGQEVAGESHYFDAIQRILGPVGPEWAEINTIAHLVPEPANRYDRNAVQVQIGGSVVGYLPREDASRYVGVLSALTSQGWLPQVPARVAGAIRPEIDYDKRGRPIERQQFVGCVRLDLGEPHLLVPANLPPPETHVVLPAGRAIQVTGEEAHLGRLAPIIGKYGDTWIYVTLHEVTEQLARSTRTVIEVRVNGLASGKLTPKMSEELLPAVRHFAERGVTTAGRAILKGNQLKADIVVYAARAGELPEEFLATVPAPRQPVEATKAPVWRFNPPPGWPEPPPGWLPPPGWSAPGYLPKPPDDWQWYVPA